MCGIAGYWDPDGFEVERARAITTTMADRIRHRGPDDGGVWLDAAAGLALGFRRLAIIDLSPKGHQPMASATGRYVIVFNGEIYNFPTLRRELEDSGHRFRGRSDTEVMLAAISAWGVRTALERFNGMFAFALWDREQRTLYLARDRAGEKPLYYGWMGRTLLFGSELKALRAHPAFAAAVDRDALALFFRLGYVPGPYTIYRGVHKLPPGTLLTLRPGATAVAPVAYWSAREVAERGVADPLQEPEDQVVAALDVLLRDAVRIRMEADVPLGAFLSGGVDSSLIVALMQAQSTRPVRTFTIGFSDERYNEAPYAAAVARHLGTEHTELYVTPADARAVIPRLPTLYDEPFADTSQIPTFLVSELTRRSVTVSLSGDAGDELFGGYRRYLLGPAIWRGMHRVPMALRRAAAALLRPGDIAAERRGLAVAVNRVARKWTGKRSITERRRQTADLLSCRSPAALYHYMMSYWKDPAAVVPDAREPLIPATDASRAPRLDGRSAHLMMYLDLVGYLPDDILVKLDRASMGVSLEARVPLLDHRVIEFAWRVPLSLQLRQGTGKLVLRQLLHRYVPPGLVERPKQGFGMPIAEWLRGPLRDWAETLLDERSVRDRGLDPQPVRRKWLQHLSGETRWDYELWTMLMFQAWALATLSERPASPIDAAPPRTVAGVAHD